MLEVILNSAIVILSLGAGAASVLLSLRLMTAHKLQYLNTYWYYQILLFIFGLYGLLGNLLIRKILTDLQIPVTLIRSVIEFIPYLGVPVIITAWFMFIKMSFEMVGRKMVRYSGPIYFGTIILLLLLYIYLIVYHYGIDSVQAGLLISHLKTAFILLHSLTLLVAFFIFYGLGALVKPVSRKAMIWRFAHINVAIGAATIILFILSDAGAIYEKVYLIVFFAGQLPAILFLGNQLNKYFLVTSGQGSISDIHATFIKDYQISKREWEIVERICEGLTNAQISDKLFISLQTVKDHTHRIYKKTAVKNRVQLTNLITGLKGN